MEKYGGEDDVDTGEERVEYKLPCHCDQHYWLWHIQGKHTKQVKPHDYYLLRVDFYSVQGFNLINSPRKLI